MISWIDLDLDFEVTDGVVALEDEAQFHAHARSMSYPDEVVRGAWSGISQIAPRYTTGEWPFDGWMGQRLAAEVASRTRRRGAEDAGSEGRLWGQGDAGGGAVTVTSRPRDRSATAIARTTSDVTRRARRGRGRSERR